MPLTRPEVLDLLSPHRERFRAAVLAAWADLQPAWQELGHVASSRSHASLLRDLIVAHLRASFHDVDGVNFGTSRGMVLLVVDNQVSVRVKKHDRRRRTSNIATIQASLFDSQQFTLPGFPEPVTCLNFGYRLNRLGTTIVEVLISYANGKTSSWYEVLDGPDLNNTASLLIHIDPQDGGSTQTVLPKEAPDKEAAPGEDTNREAARQDG